MNLPFKQYTDMLVVYLRPQWRKTLLMTVLLLISVGLQLLNPQLISYFIFYLAFVTDFTHLFGMMLAHYTQTRVSFKRMVKLLQGAPPETLVKHNPLHLKGPAPALLQPLKTGTYRLESLEATALSYRYPDTGAASKR